MTTWWKSVGRFFSYAMRILRIYLCWLLILCSAEEMDGELTIYFRNLGGDVVQESIAANVSEDTVTLEFQRPEGTLITQLVDFKNEVQIFKALVLGEEERGQSQYQVMCFVTRFPKNEFISSDAMSKLRQKNPGTIRQPEEDRGKEQFSMQLFVDLTKSSVISHQLNNVCSEASYSTYGREADLQSWSTRKGFGRDLTSLNDAVRKFPPDATDRCKDTADFWKPCTCRLEICIGWYPCGLKYCKGKDGAGKPLNYRCGIKTCKKCRIFDYYVPQKQACLWDEG